MGRILFLSRLIDKSAKCTQIVPASRTIRRPCKTSTTWFSSPKWPSAAASRRPAARWACPSRGCRAAWRISKTQLGVQLLQRSTRSLSLTPAGELYLRHCAAMRDAAQAAARGGGPGADRAARHGPHQLPGDAGAKQRRRRCCRCSCSAIPRCGSRCGCSTARWTRSRRASTSRCACGRSSRTARRWWPSSFGVSRGMLVAQPELLQRQGPVRTPDDLERLDTVAMSAAATAAPAGASKGPTARCTPSPHTPALRGGRPD